MPFPSAKYFAVVVVVNNTRLPILSTIFTHKVKFLQKPNFLKQKLGENLISIFVRMQCTIMTQARLRHSQNFDKIDSFLKSFLNIFIFRNLIVGWGRGGWAVIKEGAGILHQIYRFSGGVYSREGKNSSK